MMALPAPLRDPIGRRILASTVLLVVILVAALSAAGLYWTERSRIHALDRKALLVAHFVKRDVERALTLGVPLDRIPGMVEYLGHQLATNRDLRFIAVTDAEGHRLFYEGIGRRRLDPILDRVPLDRWREPGRPLNPATPQPVVVQGFSLSTVPLARNGGVAGFVHVGVQDIEVLRDIRKGASGVALAALAGLLLSVEIALLAYLLIWRAPLARLDALLRRSVAGGPFELSVSHAEDEMGSAMKAANSVLRRLHHAMERMRRLADEVEEAAFTPEVAERVRALRSGVIAELPGAVETPRPASGLHATIVLVPVFLSLLAAGLGIGLLLTGTGPFAWNAPAAIPLALALALTLLARNRLSAPRAMKVGGGLLMLGALAPLTVAAVPAAGDPEAGVAVALLLLGAGLVLEGAVRHALDAGARHPWRLVLPHAVNGAVIGGLAGLVVDGTVGLRVGLGLVVALALAMLAFRLTRTRG